VKTTTMIGIVLTSFLGVGSVAAQQSGSCGTGKLVDLDTRIQTTAAMSTGHFEERVKKNGKKTLDGYTYSGDQTQEIYVLTIEIGDMIYTAENVKNLFFGYNPTDMVVNDPVEVCVEKNKLFLTRPDAKKYKTRIVRSERDPQVLGVSTLLCKRPGFVFGDGCARGTVPSLAQRCIKDSALS
jgi:hypothetical protein